MSDTPDTDHTGDVETSPWDRLNQPPAPADQSRRNQAIVAAIAAVAVAAIAVSIYTVATRPDTEDRYLAALADAELDGEFAADRAALRFAEQTCDDLDNGGDPAGTETAAIAVEHFCDEYADAFEILAVRQVKGTFRLIDWESADNGCRGTGGYSDVQEGMVITVENVDGEVLATTFLGEPELSSAVTCAFPFEVEVMEGEDRYLFALGDGGRRGKVPLSWAEVIVGPQLSLGGS